MNKKVLISLLSLLVIFMTSCDTKNNKNESEKATEELKTETEWISLFNGEDLSGWRSFHSDTITGWTVEDGYLTALGEGGDLGGDIITTEMYDNFILELEWKISAGGNSGVMFRVVEDGYTSTYETGPEYQLIDDLGFGSPIEAWQMTGANYAMHNAADDKIVNPIGEFNTTKIVVDSAHVEHWLNGKKIVEYELWTDDWKKLKENGKWQNYPDYGLQKKGYISLQDHGAKTWFKNIRLTIL